MSFSNSSRSMALQVSSPNYQLGNYQYMGFHFKNLVLKLGINHIKVFPFGSKAVQRLRVQVISHCRSLCHLDILEKRDETYYYQFRDLLYLSLVLKIHSIPNPSNHC